jgi:ABC-type uncharacterized transport system auxiliary subunit
VRPALLLVAAAAGSCASSVPPDRLYHFSTIPVPAAAERAPLSLEVRPFALAPHLQGDRLAARISPVELEYYAGHRWAAPLEEILAEAVLQGLREAGLFAAVVRSEDPGARPDLTLSGYVRTCEEEDRFDGWWGVAVLEVALRDAGSGRVLWSGEVRGERRAGGRHPARVVEALLGALGDALGSIPWGKAATAPASSPSVPER